ncbi:hypothetical protein Tco_0574565, partial [Tanacetum coccineum]
RTEAEEQEAAGLLHETHERLLKGVQIMSIEERLAADTKKAIKANILVIGPQQTAGSCKELG